MILSASELAVKLTASAFAAVWSILPFVPYAPKVPFRLTLMPSTSKVLLLRFTPSSSWSLTFMENSAS